MTAIPDLIRSPWTPKQVAALNTYQRSAAFHPFTCAHRDTAHADHGEGDAGVLVATGEGWVCRDCDYRQDWAHAFMANGNTGDSGSPSGWLTDRSAP